MDELDLTKDTLVDTRVASQMLTVSYNTMNMWRSKGLGPKFYVVGGAIRYRVSDLSDFVIPTAPESRAS